MKKFPFLLLLAIGLFGCQQKERSRKYTDLTLTTVFEDSVSIRAITFLEDGTLAFAGSNGMYGTVDVNSGKVRANVQRHDSILPEFRAVGHTRPDFFMLSIVSPALLYKTGNNGQMELVYKEEGEGVFYDALTFWNDLEGIAMGDTVDGCISIIMTRDGGQTWTKVPCSHLPEGIEGEGAFAASNSTIAVMGDQAWIGTTEGRIYHTMDKGGTWQVYQSPIVHGQPTQGIYSLDFYDEKVGFGIGGDYTQPESNKANKIMTLDGGKTWNLIADGQNPNYKSCVQFVPDAGGQDLVAVGFTGIDYSHDGGKNWKHLSDEGFYTIRFLNDSIAYAAGKNRIAKLVFQ